MSRPGSAGTVLFFALFRVGFRPDPVVSMARAVGDMGGDHRPGLGANGERRQKVDFQNRRKIKRAIFNKSLDNKTLE